MRRRWDLLLAVVVVALLAPFALRPTAQPAARRSAEASAPRPTADSSSAKVATSDWWKVQDLGCQAVERRDYGQAERCFEQAVRLEERREAPDPDRLVASLESLAQVKDSLGQRAAGEELRSRASRLRNRVPVQSVAPAGPGR